MNKKLAFSVSTAEQQEDFSLYEGISEKSFISEKENLHDFLNSVSQLKKEVERLSFMMSEIRQVLETSSSVNRQLA